MRALLLFFLAVHGLVHLGGFIKAFGLVHQRLPMQQVAPLTGFMWMMASGLFMLAALLVFIKKDWWWLAAAVAIPLSQYLISCNWQEAKWGTVVNGILLIAIVIGFAGWKFRNRFRAEVKLRMEESQTIPDILLTEADILQLPVLIRKYLRYCGVVGKAKVKHFRIAFTGRIRKTAQSPWMPFSSVQYNFMHSPTRLFFMQAIMQHLPVDGFHCYKDGKAYMDIRLLSLLRVQYEAGKEMDISETVTFFNDMCCLAPATLIDPRIEWLEENDHSVKAGFSQNGINITAWLYFNEEGQLVNFVSQDRYAAGAKHTMRRLRWSTPITKYATIRCYTLAGNADAVYRYPEGDLTYGNFVITDVEYNGDSRE